MFSLLLDRCTLNFQYDLFGTLHLHSLHSSKWEFTAISKSLKRVTQFHYKNKSVAWCVERLFGKSLSRFTSHESPRFFKGGQARMERGQKYSVCWLPVTARARCWIRGIVLVVIPYTIPIFLLQFKTLCLPVLPLSNMACFCFLYSRS